MISEVSAPTATEPADVGGKAASLFRLAGLGFDVPPFFALTADAYRAHPDGRLSPDARAAVTVAWERLGGDRHAYAVRSSSVAEDGGDDSFAGIFDTVLDVRGADGVVAAIEQCWASHRSGRAAAYRENRGVGFDPAMAVVVQRMVEATWAGVSFTADPLTQALSVTVVNAVRGIGEDLVSGLVNPEEIRVRTADGAVLERARPPGAEPFPDDLLAEIVAVSNRVADAAGFPQDLEWAVEAGKLWLLQSRPITTITGVVHDRPLEPWTGRGDPDNADRVWARAYADEIWTPPVSPLFYDVQNLTHLVTGALARYGDTAPTPPDVFKRFRAAAYVDAGVLERLYAGLPKVARRPGLLDQLPAERRERLANAPWKLSRAMRRFWLFEVTNGARWGVTRNHRFLAGAWDGFLARTQPLMDSDRAVMSDAELDAHLAEIMACAGSIGPECQVAVVYHAQEIKLVLSGLLDRWFGDGDRLYGEVSSGLPDSHTVREAQAVWDLATRLRDAGSADLADLPWAAAQARLAERGPWSFIGEFEAFRREHRHRGGNYKDLIHPRWGDDPELLWTQVRSLLSSTGPGPAALNAGGAERRVRTQAELLGRVRSLRRTVLKALFRFNEIYASLRDNHRFYYDRIWWLVRQVHLEKGRRLAATGKLAQADDVFMLGRPEIAALAAGTLDQALAAERIRVRRSEWIETQRTLPPKFLVRGYAPAEEAAPGDIDGMLPGVGASSGEATGVARVLHDISGLAALQPGEILVTRQTDPSWSPAFARLGALVLETGGVLAHGASLCREFGLPCVTAVEGATARIGDGDLIRVSGSLGRVEILRAATDTTSRSDHELQASA